jgi:histidinol-phosphate aminotransferase
MPRYRADLDRIARYVPGRGEQEILRAYQLASVVKLASNESPLPPFPQVVDAIQQAAHGVHRYPETVYTELGAAVATHLGVDPQNLWFGGGGASLLFNTALAVGGPGTSAVYATPSFVVYRMGTALAGATPIEVPLDADHRHDLDAMAAAVRDDTTIVYICNPNNPTGTYVPTRDVADFIAGVPESVLVVVDEAYFEFVDRSDYQSMAQAAAASPNVVVMRTFSKIYGLAGLRIGYLVGHHEVLEALRRTQLPFTVTGLAQAAAVESLRHPAEVAGRLTLNAAGVVQLTEGLRSLGMDVADSVTNFVYAKPPMDPGPFVEELLRLGVIVRPTGSPWVRITVGTKDENSAFLAAVEAVIPPRT